MPDIDYVSSKPLPENLSDIADSLRNKTGISGEIHTDEMASMIDAIPTGTPLPPLTNPASASDILDGKEVILPDANNQPVKVTGMLVPSELSSYWLTVHKALVTVGENNVSNMTQCAPYFAGILGIDASKICVFSLIGKVNLGENYIPIRCTATITGGASWTLYRTDPYGNTVSTASMATSWTARLIAGSTYEVFYSDSTVPTNDKVFN